MERGCSDGGPDQFAVKSKDMGWSFLTTDEWMDSEEKMIWGNGIVRYTYW